MSISSGQLVEARIARVECVGYTDDHQVTLCTFGGLEDVWVDPEVNMWGWVCPECHTDYAEPIDTFPGSIR